MRGLCTKALAAGVILLGGVVVGPGSAEAAAPQATGLLAPTVSFTFEGEGTLGQFGSSVGIFASYTCRKTLDSPIVPQLLGSSSTFTLEITQNIGNSGTQTITKASRTLTDLRCNGTPQRGAIFAATEVGELPLLEGEGVAVVTIRVCDLFGCAAASSVGVVDMS